MSFKTMIIAAAFTVSAGIASAAGHAATGNPMVGGAPMLATQNIVENAVNSADHTTLVAAVKAAGLVDALMGPGPFTVFAPLNTAFDALPAGTVETLLKPENKSQLQGILKAHVVSGKFKAKNIVALAKANGGTADIQTVSGDTLTAVLSGDTLYVRDETGGLASVAIADIKKSNGVVHVVDKVLLPASDNAS